jgi:hypothetical protein
MYRDSSDEFAFTRAAATAGGPLELHGTSLRYAAIVALGAHLLPPELQPAVLGGHDLNTFVAKLVHRLSDVNNLGDVALVCWAAAQTRHSLLDDALRRLAQVDQPGPQYTVEAAWVVSALASARGQRDVEAPLAAARERLLSSVLGTSPLFPHQTAAGLVKPYRAHVACFADQVYPIQALARLHRTGEDKPALAMAQRCAEQICRLQGPGGQWWWHYDARTGAVIEGYPVYTVHQHAMAPMALMDLAEASGGSGEFADEIRRGLTWIIAPPELGPDAESMVREPDGVTWRKVFRGDPRKFVRGLQTVTTRVSPGLRAPGLDRLYPPTAIDRECRPYEFGWLLFTWPGDAAVRSDGAADDRARQQGIA